MSYCRWSSDNFQCDLYCYEDSTGYVTHVAGSRYVTVPEVSLDAVIAEPDPVKRVALLARYNAWNDEDQETIPIGLPYDSFSFHDPDLESFLERLTTLREAGYRMPDYMFERIKEEMADDQSA